MLRFRGRNLNVAKAFQVPSKEERARAAAAREQEMKRRDTCSTRTQLWRRIQLGGVGEREPLVSRP